MRDVAFIDRCNRSARVVEHHVLPLLVAVSLGFWLGDWMAGRDAQREAQQWAELVFAAAAKASLAEAKLQRWQEACTPLLPLPIESVPELLTSAAVVPGSRP